MQGWVGFRVFGFSVCVRALCLLCAWKVFPQLLDPGCLPPWLRLKFRMERSHKQYKIVPA